MSTPFPKIPTFLPQFLDFKSMFKNSLESIEGTTYSSIFDDIYPNSNMCKDGGKEFTDISSWYGATWKSRTNSSTTKPTDLVSMCEAYQKECLLGTNWTVVNGWKNDNDTKSLTQFCPQPPPSTTKQPSSSGFTFLTTDFKSSAKLATSPSTSSIRAFNGSIFYSSGADPESTTINGSSIPDSKRTSAGDGDGSSLNYLAFLSLLLPVIIAIVVAVLLIRRRNRRPGVKRPTKELSSSNLVLNLSPPSTPYSTGDSRNFDASEKKELKTKRRGGNKFVPRQLSVDSNSSAIYFVNFEEARRESIGEESTDDPDKEKMMENWKQKLESLAEMLTRSDGNVNVAMNGVVGQEDC